MGSADSIAVDDALDELVNQFADPMSFFRELIQNALDAGSPEVDVHVEFEVEDAPAGALDPGAAAPDESEVSGVLVVRVDDYGEGMDKELIDTRLTRLFSSTKEGDLTKIGKFGIGFVSVFAIDPHMVCVDTSRAGEHWRVLFDRDRRFRCLRLDAPVDGTKVTIYKPATRAEFRRFEARAREVVSYWCKHTQGEVRFQDELVSRPLGFGSVAGALREELRDDGFSRVVVAHLPGSPTFHGYYNQGLTLVEQREADPELPELTGIAFKVSSPHLEHTLTRDTVLRDRSFARAMDQVVATVEGPLCDQVFGALETALVATEGGALEPLTTPELAQVVEAATWHLTRGHRGVRARAASPVCVSPSGRRWSAAEVRAAAGRGALLVAGAASHVTQALEQGGRLVVFAPPGSAWLGLLDALARGRWRPVSSEVACPRPPDTLELARWRPLQGATEFLLRRWGARVQGVALGHFDYPESPIRAHVVVTQAQLGEMTPLAELSSLGRGLFSRRRVVVINADHPTVGTLVALAASEPEMAAYQLTKLFLLGETLDEAVDGELALITMEQRRCRSRAG